MRLYLAISGDNKEDVLAKLRAALETEGFFSDDNACAEEYDESKEPGEDGRVLFQVDYQWTDEGGFPYLADLFPESE